MIKHFIATFTFTLTILVAYGQIPKPKIAYSSSAVAYQKNTGVKSVGQTTPLSYRILQSHSTEKWAMQVRATFSRKHYSQQIAAIKANKLQNKIASYNPREESGSRAITPVIGVNFEANWLLQGTPPDNSMAISNNGFIVTATNDGIEYYNQQGQLLYTDFWSDFFNDPALTSTIYDPRVIYDSGSDRFVLVVLHGSTASTSKVIVCFSQSNNPQSGGWWVYQLTGNPLNNNCWFDYPALGVSTNEIYVTGNLFVTNGAFNQAVIYQIPKSAGYSGNSLNWQYWSGLSNSPFDAFCLVPVSYGHSGNIGPGAFLVSNESAGASQIILWDLTDDMSGNPQLNSFTVSTSSYSVAANALQLGSSDELDIGDCRIQNAFYLNDIIHFVFHSDIGNGWNGINYNRLSLNLTNQSSAYGLQGSYDYCYPAVVPYSTSITDKSVMIAFLRASSSSYPEVRVVNCDNNMQWSSSTLVKSGETYVDILQGEERWGDYTGIARKHNSSTAKIWLAGCYGANIPSQSVSNTYKTWVAEVSETSSGLPPVTNFSGNPTTGLAPLTVYFSDLSSNNPTSWNWSFPGGSPSSSTANNPTVVYNNSGTFNVSLTSSNSFGTNSATKNNYITVNQAGVAPVANFTASPTSGFAPLTVSFSDASSNTPTSWSWLFPGGNPSSSNVANPIVNYNSEGSFDVRLTTSNSFGTDTETKNNYISVSLSVNVEAADQVAGNKIYPNPVYNFLYIDFSFAGNEEVSVKIVDSEGKTVKLLYRDTPQKGKNLLSFNKGALSAGTYFVIVETKSEVIKNEKVIILN